MAKFGTSEAYKETIIQNVFPKRAQENSKLKVLYATGDAECSCCTRWSEYADAADEEKDLKYKTQGHDVVHRMRRPEGKHSNMRPWETHSIVIRGKLAGDIVANVWMGYPGLVYKPTELELTPPFRPVLHRWDKLRDYLPDHGKSGQSLLDLFQQCIADDLGKLETIRSTRLCTFESLWMIFAPGELVRGMYHNATAIFKLHRCILNEPPQQPRVWCLYVHYVDWNGSRCGLASKAFHIHEYKESRAIDTLELLPLALMNTRDRQAIQSTCITRGQKFESLRGYHFRASEATKIVEEPSQWGQVETVEKPVSGRVIVDACAYYRCQDRVKRELIPLSDTKIGADETQAKNSKCSTKRKHEEIESDDESSEEDTHDSNDSGDGSRGDGSRGNGVRGNGVRGNGVRGNGVRGNGIRGNLIRGNGFRGNGFRGNVIRGNGIRGNGIQGHGIQSSAVSRFRDVDFEKFRRDEDLTPLEDEHRILACPCVKGFDLKSKEWCELFVDELHEITWIDEVFDKLVLPAGRKELVLASVKHRNKALDMDFVPGKGQGLCALMFGPPGVGKTLTAEAIAEKSRLPLYLLNASDLGTRPREMEKSLSLALECCSLWKAILLLDEADIFLTTRSLENLERNELVSIFLRHLERYQGVLFLTTNRMQVLDPAFQSRVDIFLAYKDLEPTARKQVWRNLIALAGPDRVCVSEEDLDVLAAIKLNGREIKSLMKSALLLDIEDYKTVGVTELQGLAEMRIEAQQILNSGNA